MSENKKVVFVAEPAFIRVPNAQMQLRNEALAKQNDNMRRIRKRYGEKLCVRG